MKDNFADKVTDALNERLDKVKSKLREQYKNVKPFRMEPMSNDEVLSIYDRINEEDWNYAIATYGEDAVNSFIFECETIEQKRGGINANTYSAT